MQKTVKEIIDQRRNKAIKVQQNHIKEIYVKIPEIKEIDEELNVLYIQKNKNILNNLTNKFEDIKIKELEEKKTRVLKENNFKENYLFVKFYCDLCFDTGILDNGDMCKCFKKLVLEKSYETGNIVNFSSKDKLKKFDLNIFRSQKKPGEYRSPRENMENILSIIKVFIKKVSKGEGHNFLFQGPVGTGKTFLCNNIAKAFIDTNVNVIYQTAYQLIDTINSYTFAYGEKKFDYKESRDRLFEVDVLIIDDLGTEMINDVSLSHIFEILNSRINNKQTTIISTNLSIEEIRRIYSERTASRILGNYDVFEIFGEDLRIK